jgi:hypothetical protein
LRGVQLADLPDSSGERRRQQDRGWDREEEDAQQVREVVDALLALAARFGDLAACAGARVTERVSDLAPDDR